MYYILKGLDEGGNCDYLTYYFILIHIKKIIKKIFIKKMMYKIVLELNIETSFSAIPNSTGTTTNNYNFSDSAAI